MSNTIAAFSYTQQTPSGYVCSACEARGVKLWRQYQTFAEHIELLCAECALKDQKKTGPIDDDGKRESNGMRSDQIGWLVPAVPTEDGGTFWGYTSVPESGVRWWRRLPTYERLHQ